MEGDGIDWNQTELTLLGDISFAVPVTIYDDGKHRNPMPHSELFTGTLLYVPGALLNSSSFPPADWNEVVREDEIDFGCLCALYERRLLPALQYAR